MNTETPNPPPPSIGSLRAFEAAARHENFTSAARELSLTQSAVSHAVRDLEARFSVALFRRTGRMVELTEAGKRYAPFVREALARLRAGDEALRDPERRARVLTVSVSPSFAAKWLGPRIGEFASLHPDFDLRVSASAAHVDFIDDDIDLAIRHGDGNWPALTSIRLCEEMWLPVAAPLLAGKVNTANDLAGIPLIHHRDSAAWRRWFDEHEIPVRQRALPGVTFSEMSLAIDAAVAGQGVALARSALAARDLIAGRLICPTKSGSEADFSYWIVRPKGRARSRKSTRFIDWLKQEAAAEQQALAAILA